MGTLTATYLFEVEVEFENEITYGEVAAAAEEIEVFIETCLRSVTVKNVKEA